MRNCNYYDRCSIAERQRETAITTTAPVLQIGRNSNCNDRSNIAERETAITTAEQVLQRDETAITTTAPVLQIGRNCNYFDRSGIAEIREPAITRTAPVLQRKREELHLLVLQRERNCYYCDPSSMANREKLQVLRPLQCYSVRDRETATTTTAPNQSWKAANLEESKVGRCVLFQPWGAGVWGAHVPTLRLPPYGGAWKSYRFFLTLQWTPKSWNILTLTFSAP